MTNKLTPPYSAALLDGEGAVMIQSTKRHNKNGKITYGYKLVCSITMRELPLIEALLRTYGGNLRIQKPRCERHSVAYRWTVVAREAASFLRIVEPWLWAKNKQAKLGLEFQALMNRPAKFQRSDLQRQHQKFFYLQMKELNRKGIGK